MKKPFIISVSGISGSGKTTVVAALKERLPTAEVICFDDIPGDLLGRDYCEWSAAGANCNEWKLAPLIDKIKQLMAEKPDHIIIDYPFGSVHNEVGAYVDFSVWVDVPLDISLARRLLRDFIRRSPARRPLKMSVHEEISSYLDFYLTRNRDTFFKHIETIRPFADLIIDGTKPPDENADEIIANI